MENKRPFKTIYTCFPQGKHKVLTMSYDDGKIFDRKLIEIFNKYGIKGTFHLNTGIMPVDEDRIQLSEVKELYKGHEVSCHTSTHPTIERCPLDQVVQQVIEDRKALEDAVGYPVRGLSYPNGSYSKDIINLLPACGIEYSRVVGSTDDFAFPDNFLEWKSTCHHLSLIHISEPTRRTPISYAVFCLKKKKKQTHNPPPPTPYWVRKQYTEANNDI